MVGVQWQIACWTLALLSGPAWAAEGEDEPAAVEGAVPMSHTTVKIRRRVNPSYPAAAEALGLGPTRCTFHVFIDEEGVPYDVTFDDCPQVFQTETRTTILKWRWYPAKMKSGAAVKARLPLKIMYMTNTVRNSGGVVGGRPDAQSLSDRPMVAYQDLPVRRAQPIDAPEMLKAKAAVCNVTLLVEPSGIVSAVPYLAGCTGALEKAVREGLMSWTFTSTKELGYSNGVQVPLTVEFLAR